MKTNEQINAISWIAAGTSSLPAFLGGFEGPADARMPRYGAAAGFSVKARTGAATGAHVPGTSVWSPPT